jgi:hypothetical protein
MRTKSLISIYYNISKKIPLSRGKFSFSLLNFQVITIRFKTDSFGKENQSKNNDSLYSLRYLSINSEASTQPFLSLE